MDLVDRKMRDSMVLPTMRCAQCNNEVYIRMIGQHVCEKQPALPTVPPPLKDRGLSSFFGRSKDSAAPPAAARKGADSQEIPAAYKPSLRLLAEDGGDNDDFDFDDMLHNAASYKGGAMSNDSLYDAVSPGTRRAPPVYAQSNSSASVDSMAAGFSPIGMMPSPGAPMHAGGSRLERAREELVADSHARSLPMNHGSGPPTQSGSVSRGNAATLQNSLLQQLAESDTDFDMPPAKQPMPWHTKHVEETLQSSNRRSPAPVASSLSSPVISSSVPSAPEPAPSVAAASAPKPAFTQAPPFYNKTAGAANVMFSPTPSSPESELSLTLDQPSPSNTSQITSPSLSQVSSPAMSPPAWQKNNSVARLQTSHRKTGSTDEARGTLSIGGMMKSHSLKGLRQNSDLGSMDAPGDPSLQGGHQNQDSSRAPSGSLSINRADSLGSDHPRSPPAITVDTQIRLSSRKAPTSANAASTSASPTPTHVSSFSSSFTQPERNISRTATAPISTARNTSPDRQVSRTPTAPSVMLPLSSSMPKPVTGSAPAPNPLDVLASLMGGASQQPSKTQPASTLPSINTQFGGKSGGHMRTKSSGLGLSPHLGHNATTRVPSLQKSGGSGSKGLKSAKLDSLLDDLMGEMQALSAEVRTESDRDSVVSSHSSHMQAAASSPTEAAHRRGRFDSTVSTTSTSSTLSTGGLAKRVPCASCGTGISSAKGAVAQSTRLPKSGEIPFGVQGVEHQGRVYCVRDYKKHFATTCASCNMPCETTKEVAVHALDSWWHRACFNCQECRRPFPDKSFYVFEQRPYCRYDYHKLNNSLCVACRNPIEGPCAQVFEGRFHPGCFACSHCKEPLRDIYYSLDGRFLCENHVHQHGSHKNANKRKTVFGHV